MSDISALIAADIAARTKLGAQVSARLFALTDEQIKTLMLKISYGNYLAIQTALGLSARSTAKLPHARYILEKVYNPSFHRRFETFDRRVAVLAQIADRSQGVGWHALQNKVAVALDAYLTAAVTPETFTAAQLALVRRPFAGMLDS
jgi:hypothetical protein